MDTDKLIKTFFYRMSRSGGKGGQHVNKVSTKVEVIFDLIKSELFSAEQKELIHTNLGNRINSSGQVQVICQTTRSQLKNKQFAIAKMVELIKKGLVKKANRKATKIPKGVRQRRLQSKKVQSEKKAMRKKIDFD